MSDVTNFTATPCSVSNLLHAKVLTIPAYQREYVWKPKNIISLLRDIHIGFEDDCRPMFIGSIISVTTGEHDTEIVDGQQRSITLFAILCAGLALLREQNASASDMVDFERLVQYRIKSYDMRSSAGFTDGGSKTIPSLILTYDTDKSRTVIDDLAHSRYKFREIEDLDSLQPKDRSHLRIEQAADIAYSFLLEIDPADTLKFLDYLVHRVHVVLIATKNTDIAMNIFESSNGRGIGLDSMDLVKNWLFMNSSDEAFEGLSASWQEMKRNLERAGEKPSKFLRLYSLATLSKGAIINDRGEFGIYSWIKDNRDLILAHGEPIDLANDIKDASAYYTSLKVATNQQPEYFSLKNIASISSSLRMHFLPLLAARRLDPDVRSSVLHALERLVFVRSVSGVKHGSSAERLGYELALKAREIRDLKSAQEWEDDVITRHISSLENGFRAGFERMTYPSSQRFKYAFKKLYSSVQTLAGMNPTGWEQGYDLDHFIPCGAARKDKGSVLNLLGNFTLIPKSDNRGEKGRLSPEEKLARLAGDPFILNRALAFDSSTQFGSTRQTLEVLSDCGFRPYTKFTEDEIRHRTSVLTELAWRIWSVGWIKA
jgi:Uncharacterized conserved protein